MIRKSFIVGIIILFSSAGIAQTWNNPHRSHGAQNVRYAPITGIPKTLDPARAYSSDENQILAQIYEPPLQYHYLKRPYELVPLTAAAMPTVTYYNSAGERLLAEVNPNQVAYSIYDIYITPGIYYQPHPAFAKNQQGQYLYHHLTTQQLRQYQTLHDFPKTGTRELMAHDYVYQIKRLASPKTQSPIFGVMSQHIIGLSDYSQVLEKNLLQEGEDHFLDLRQFPLEGVKILSPYHYQIKIKGVYPQFKYWLAMIFFAPIPWEADAFYSQSGMANNNITFDWYPVGTGPYQLTENNPNKQLILVRNPYFHHEKYPQEGMPEDKEKGYLTAAGKPLPFVDTVVFVLDKESIPRWNKFLQGYYDKSGVGAESFDQAIKIDQNGQPYLTPEMEKMGVRLQTTVTPGIFYIGFNMLDPVVGGYSEKQQKLRQAISILLDYEEYIAIFRNGRGIPAQGPIPPGIYGYRNGPVGINPYVYDWVGGRPQRKSLAEAKKLLAEAGYPGGMDTHTGKPLILNYDVATTGNPEDKAYFDWLRKQFKKLGIKLNIRATLYNRFQDQVRSGNAQMFSWGWLADYPDPENFLFLLYGPNGKVKHGGENAANYSNPDVDRLFEEIRNLPEGPLKQQKINELLAIVCKDSPWIWGFHPIDFALVHQWNYPSKLHGVAGNTLKYEQINVGLREKLRKEWNQPIIWPLIFLIGFMVILFIPLIVTYWHRERKPTVKKRKF